MHIDATDLLVFLTAALTLNLTPGNDMMFVLGQSLKGGARIGIAASIGIATGSAIHLGLVALGVAVLLAEHPQVFEAIRYAGAAYLIYIAYGTLSRHAVAFDANTRKRSGFEAWRDGMLVNLFNPKVVVFMFAFLPPFVRPEHGMPLLQLLVFGAIFNIGGTLINIAVSIFSGRIGKAIAGDAMKSRWFARASAAIFVILAARIAFERK